LNGIDILFILSMLAVYTGCLIATLAAAKPIRAGVALASISLIAVDFGTRYFGLNAHIGGLALALNGFFAAIFILVGLVIVGARKVLK
jgi:hypothetical protein